MRKILQMILDIKNIEEIIIKHSLSSMSYGCVKGLIEVLKTNLDIKFIDFIKKKCN
jgi:hypothetical protein